MVTYQILSSIDRIFQSLIKHHQAGKVGIRQTERETEGRKEASYLIGEVDRRTRRSRDILLVDGFRGEFVGMQFLLQLFICILELFLLNEIGLRDLEDIE